MRPCEFWEALTGLAKLPERSELTWGYSTCSFAPSECTCIWFLPKS